MKPTPKKVIAATIGRDFKPQTLRPPKFDIQEPQPVRHGNLWSILNELNTEPERTVKTVDTAQVASEETTTPLIDRLIGFAMDKFKFNFK